MLETGLINNAYGSARIRLGNTDVLVAVKAEIDKPLPSAPDRGRVQFFVDCSANATPEFEGRAQVYRFRDLSDKNVTKAKASYGFVSVVNEKVF